MFVSLVCGCLHVPSGLLEFCNAGHCPPVLLTAAGEVTPLNAARCVALSARRALDYTEARTTLAMGDTLFLYTHGVTEALDGSGMPAPRTNVKSESPRDRPATSSVS